MFGVPVAATKPARGVETSGAGWKTVSGGASMPRSAMAGPSRSAPKAAKASSLSQPSRLWQSSPSHQVRCASPPSGGRSSHPVRCRSASYWSRVMPRSVTSAMTAMSNLLELSVPRRRAPVRRPGRGRITENRVIRSAARRRIAGVQTVGVRRVVRRRAVRHGPACGGRGSGTVRAVESSGSLLAARLAAGDDRALAEAFDEFGPAVHAVARQVLGNAAAAQDVVQEVFVELWCHPQRFDETLGTLRTYLTLVARHRALDVIRSELRRSGRELRSERLLPPPPRPSPEDEVTDADTASTVRAAVRTLPEDQRRAVELAYFDGLSYRDVARRIGIPEGTAKSRVRLALAKLETMLGHELLEPS